jgi:ATP-dependent phosphofructokinase / diphosphate-dependent phosphofructokinase
MKKRRKIAINTGGGDAPGLNAVIRATTLAAIEEGYEVWGIRHGYRGLLEPEPGGLVRLDRDFVRGIGHLGGTILGTVNRGDPFHYPTVVEGGDKLTAVDRADELVARFKEQGFDALIAVGGDGSQAIARKLMERGLPRVIGVPKTIDNDVIGTEVTFGFDTAVSIATEAIDRLHTTAESHERVMVVEVMGRHAGWIALRSGLAGGADVILIPEIPFHYEPIAAKIAQREGRGRRFALVVVAEGACPAGGSIAVKDQGDEFRRTAILGGIAGRVEKELARRTGKECRSMSLGHLLRGGGPTTFDRQLALRFGAAAVRFLTETDKSGVVAICADTIDLCSFEIVTSGTKFVSPECDTVRTARALGICFGDEPPARFFAI